MAESPSTDPATEAAAARTDRAVAVLKGEGVTGTVNFEQRTPKHSMKITGMVQGLPQGQHGIAIHEFGDLSKGWKSTGHHFNPFKKDHGGPEDKIRHLGDLGNVLVDDNGTGKIEITDKFLSLSGKNSILGRSLVIHEQPDDLGKGNNRSTSKKTGSSGNGVAMGVIGIQKI
uniref:superoxide dismutase n=1 Tax=Lygus hesperus TaxID=30085 RepID=A0A0A9Y301_LYGHE